MPVCQSAINETKHWRSPHTCTHRHTNTSPPPASISSPKGSELHQISLDDFRTITLSQKWNWTSDFLNRQSSQENGNHSSLIQKTLSLFLICQVFHRSNQNRKPLNCLNATRLSNEHSLSISLSAV